MGRIRTMKMWGLFSILIFLGSGGSLSYAQWTDNGGSLTTTDNVGIGTTSPAVNLHVKNGDFGGTITATHGISIENDNHTYLQFLTPENKQGVILFSSPSRFAYGSISYKNATDSMTFGVNNSERLVINSSGNVGIGTTSPTAKLHVAGDATIDGNIAAKYQDVAEWVRTPAPLTPGTVVVIDPAESNRVLPASQPYDTRIAGVVSSQPGIILGEAGEDKAKVAHSGRVKIKVDAQYGAVAVGDLLVSSPTAGYAMISRPIELNGISIHRPGTIVGKALEPLKEGQDEILVLLTLQ